MKKGFLFGLALSAFLGTLLLCTNLPPVRADFQFAQVGGALNFMGNDVDANGVLWAGDKNFSLWKSTDNATTFQLVYYLPHEAPRFPDNPYSGLVWTVFVDSRGYIFTSGSGANNSLYRSTNGGVSFSAVLNANETSNRSFYISMTEDSSNNLYVATYTIGFAQPQLLKSTNGGTSWLKVGNFSVIHFHTIEYNPFNGYLYAVTGERSGLLSNCNDSEKIFRSKDYGATWNLVVDRNDALGTVYLPMAFAGNYVYVGQDYPSRTCQIHRFYDDGNGPFVPQIVYSPPADGCMPFISGSFFNNTLIFANSAEAQNGTSRIVTSNDGINWNILNSANVTSKDNRWNFLTEHPRSGIVFGTFKTGYSYQITDIAPPAPINPEQTSQPVSASNPIGTSNNESSITTSAHTQSAPTTTPKPKPSSDPTFPSTPTPNETKSAEPTITTPTSSTIAKTNNNGATLISNPFAQILLVATVLCSAVSITVHAIKKRKGQK